jgi:hypothetical protein
MASLAYIQAQFRASILTDSNLNISPTLKQTGIPPNASLVVYRNNVQSSLRRALAEIFPVASKLVGPAFFAAVANEYISLAPPTQARLNDYGQTFPNFLRGFPPAATLPWLGDVAMLELAWNEAFHATDEKAITLPALSSVPPESLPTLRLKLHATARLVQSDAPIDDIWLANQEDADPEQTVDLAEGGRDLLVLRPDHEVLIHSLPKAHWSFLSALNASHTLADAFELTTADTPEFDLESALGALFSLGVFCGFSTEETELDHA